ncbi:MAG: hypothetical protein JWL70_2678 [Acidimicrobiia bacterium]|nr:hypothetical protein [Acidimicrobiia bacterium]
MGTSTSWLIRKPKRADVHANAGGPSGEGWCLTGTAAAAEWGAPVVAASPRLDVYVPSEVAVNLARRTYGSAPSASDSVASVAVAPAPTITHQRLTGHRKSSWPLAHPVAVALDLAQDRGRGREVLEAWTPPPEFVRVW